MNTRLLMTMHAKVGTPLNIGAVPHGTRRTAPLSGGTFEGPRLRGTILPGAVPTGSSFVPTACWKWTFGSPSRPMMARSSR